MAGFGELVLVLGDIHIPHRASVIPEKFKRMLVPNKMQHVICTGNVGSLDQYEEIRALAPHVHVVAGDFDYEPGGVGGILQLPETRVLQVGHFRIGVIHGHQVLPYSDASLSRMRRKLNVDILISGHTHQQEVLEYDRHYHINPGSITGAFSATTEQVKPSFMLLAIQNSKVVCFVYELINGEVEVSKREFDKKVEGKSNDLLQSLLR